MKATIVVKDREERDAIRSGLDDPLVRAFVVVSGILRKLPSDRARQRVLTFVADTIAEEQQDA